MSRLKRNNEWAAEARKGLLKETDNKKLNVFVDTIREILGLAPLYTKSKERQTDAERFTNVPTYRDPDSRVSADGRVVTRL